MNQADTDSKSSNAATENKLLTVAHMFQGTILPDDAEEVVDTEIAEHPPDSNPESWLTPGTLKPGDVQAIRLLWRKNGYKAMTLPPMERSDFSRYILDYMLKDASGRDAAVSREHLVATLKKAAPGKATDALDIIKYLTTAVTDENKLVDVLTTELLDRLVTGEPAQSCR